LISVFLPVLPVFFPRNLPRIDCGLALILNKGIRVQGSGGQKTTPDSGELRCVFPVDSFSMTKSAKLPVNWGGNFFRGARRVSASWQVSELAGRQRLVKNGLAFAVEVRCRRHGTSAIVRRLLVLTPKKALFCAKKVCFWRRMTSEKGFPRKSEGRIS
jgi:hypothetical protein